MQINDFHNILELVKQDSLRSEAEYPKLLKVFDMFSIGILTNIEFWFIIKYKFSIGIERGVLWHKY